MRYISDAALNRQLLDEWDIPALFSTPNLNFSLVEYQPGEYLTAPYTKTERLLFLVRGTISIRSIRMDGSEYVLHSGDRFTLLESDVTFLHYLLRSLTDKLKHSTRTETTGGSLEDRLLHWMDKSCPDGTLTHMGETAALLHCSTRQLQRVLRHLTETGVLRRVGKGIYQRNFSK